MKEESASVGDAAAKTDNHIADDNGEEGDIILGTTTPAQPSPPCQPSSSDSNEKKWNEDRKFMLELLAFIVLCAYTGFSCLQWLQIRYTNHLTARALDSGDQALQKTLTKMQAQIDAANTANDNTAQMFQAKFIMWDLISGERGHINVAFKNIGKMTASDVYAVGQLQVVSLRSGAILTNQDVKKQLGTVQPEGSPDRALWFDIPKYTNTDGIGTDSELSSYFGDKVVYVNISLRYNGGFGKSVTQKFCKAIIADSSVNSNHNLFPEMPECGDAPYYVKLRKSQIQ